MVAKKPTRGVNPTDVDHTYHNITDASAHQLSTAASRASPASAPTQSPGQAPTNGFESRAPAELSGHAVLQEETGAEESHVYDGLQTPNDSDRAPYTSLVLQEKQDTARNCHTYQNPAFHTSDTAHDYYNL
ncbi:uncharacterized protein [Littorina saxatilis]|uniref:uncharacterized protein n=1 Tax=Littorina saxatilis TaxID=31220 RepID=UPI0038B5139F